MDNFNNVVKVVRNDPSLQRNVGSLKEEAAAGTKKAGVVFNEGDVVLRKIANVRLTPPIPASRWPLSPEEKSWS